MKSRTIRTVGTIAVTGALLLGGAGVASAADSAGRAKAEKHTANATDSTRHHRDQRATDSTLTAAQKETARAAALAKVSGTVHRVRADRVDGYVVIVTATDGTKTAVKLDQDFNVTGTEAAKDTDKDKAGSKGSRSGKRSGEASAAA
jgi:hypothetical protein